MKLLVASAKKIFKLYYNSFLNVHFAIILFSFLIDYIVKNYVDSTIVSTNYVSLLNGMGVLTSFFILVIDKMDLGKLNIRFNNLENIPFTKKQIRQGSKALNLIFSITFSMFVLLAIQYILLFFNVLFLILLILLIVNIFTGFIIVLVLWHTIEGNN